MRGARGFSLLETVIALAMFSTLILIMTALQGEMLRYDRRVRIAFATHPDSVAVVARLRRDILDARSYPSGSFQGFTQTPTTLVVRKAVAAGPPETVVYDFTVPGQAKRTVWVGGRQDSQWRANGVPAFEIGSFPTPSGEIAVRVRAWEIREGRLAYDQIFQPRY